MHRIIAALKIPVVAELSPGYRALTVPIRIEDADVVSSIWATLHFCSDAVATIADASIQFWDAEFGGARCEIGPEPFLDGLERVRALRERSLSIKAAAARGSRESHLRRCRRP